MFICGLQTNCGDSNVNLERISGEVIVRGFVAHLSVELLYINPTKKALEVSYVCPVDAKAAVYSFEAKLDGRTITAHCMEKKKAKKAYENAVKQGHTAILGSENELSGDLIHLSLGNLPQGETAELKLKMVMELPVGVGGDVTFTLPAVFNPRYSPANQPPDYNGAPNAIHPSKIPYVFDVKGEVRGVYKIAKVISHSDPINVNITEDDTVATITQDGGFTRDHDWSFQIYYQTVHVPHALQMKGDRSCKGLMKDDILMLNIFPEVPPQGYSPHNELIFVVDRSGSMEGTKMERAKGTLLFILKSLPSGCRFNIICFGSHFSSLFKGSSERYTDETLKKALELQKSMQANMGGTEILNALSHVYSKDLIPGYPRQTMVLTDGEVWNLKQVFDLVSRHANDTRMFSVGIGDGASTALVQGIADAGRGRFEMVIHERELQTKVMGLLASMLQENIANLKVECDLTPPQDLTLVPKIAPYIFGGQHLILYARVTPNSEVNSIKVTWKTGATEIASEVKERDCAKIHDSNFSFHRLAAKTQLKQWEKETDELDNANMIELSVSSGVVCKATALVGIDQDSQVIKEEEREFRSIRGQTRHQSLALDRSLCYMRSNITSAIPQGAVLLPPPPPLPPSAFVGGQPESFSSMARTFTMSSFKSSDTALRRNKVRTEEEDSVDDMFDSGPELEREMEEEIQDSLFFLVSVQNFDGSWDIEHCQKVMDNLEEQQLKDFQLKVRLDDACLATVICLSFIETSFESRKQEWEFVNIKARKFLELKSVDVAGLLELFSKLLEKHIPQDIK